MSSIEERLDSFYRTRIVTAAAALRARGVDVLEHSSGDSFYVAAPRDPDLLEIEAEQFAARLSARWKSEGLSELEPVAHELGELIGELELPSEASEELSPFIYVMF
jgi:hypothetical protein